MKNQIKSIFALGCLCAAFALVSVEDVQVNAGKVWWGIGEVVASQGASFGERAAVGAIGIADAAVWGFAVGSIGTPAAGIAAGAIAAA